MRYQNWDVLIFPGRSMIPLQEFKTTCHVVQDHVVCETLQPRNSMLLLPTVTSFIQSLPPGEQFRFSIHAWENPEPSRHAYDVAKEPDQVMFEAKVLIDGRVTGTEVFNRNGPWPAIIKNSIHVEEDAEVEHLKFPVFHHELLTQSYWNAGDELGRIKVVIAEGIRRNSSSSNFDRIKNIVAFSFQHAPLDILEASSIAWPNLAMWRQVSFSTSYFPQFVSPRHVNSTGALAHSHSPRLRTSSDRSALPPPTLGPMLPPGPPVISRHSHCDPFLESIYIGRKASSTDTSMPDYSRPSSLASSSRRVTDPMITDKTERRYETLQSPGAYEFICETLLPSAPENTPQNDRGDQPCAAMDNKMDNAQFEADYVSVKTSVQLVMSTANGGAKRQRVITPAACRVIDEEDEPRSSPNRKISQVVAAQDGERRILNGIDLNIL